MNNTIQKIEAGAELDAAKERIKELEAIVRDLADYGENGNNTNVWDLVGRARAALETK